MYRTRVERVTDDMTTTIVITMQHGYYVIR